MRPSPVIRWMAIMPSPPSPVKSRRIRPGLIPVTRYEARFPRSSRVDVVIQAVPPSQPFTLGGSSRLWPRSAALWTRYCGGGFTSSRRERDTTNSTGPMGDRVLEWVQARLYPASPEEVSRKLLRFRII